MERGSTGEEGPTGTPEEEGARPHRESDGGAGAEGEGGLGGFEGLEAAPGGQQEVEGGGGSVAQLEDLQDELNALNDRHLRLAAEFDNYRKRTNRERDEVRRRSEAELAARLLDSLDDLQRVASVEAASTTVEAIHEGVELVEKKLRRALEAAGLEAVDAAGELFNPETMEAIMTAPAEHPEEDDVVHQVFQPGYRFHGILLRPARVGVKKYEG